MVSKPVLGYPSKRAAIWAMLDDDVPHKEIAEKDVSEQQVYVAASEKRRSDAVRMPVDKRMRALRIYAAALGVISEALEVTPDILHNVFSKVLANDLKALTSPKMKVADVVSKPAEPQTVVEEETYTPPQRPKPTPASTSGDVRMVSLDGRYLHESCTSLTRDVRYAWRGPTIKAQKVKEKFTIAKGLSEIPVLR